MPRAMRTARPTLLALAVAGAPGFGASAALATPAPAAGEECPAR
jgi:hypothetical protein